MKYLQLITIEKITYPKSYREEEYVHEELHPPLGVAMFCPRCGEIWATATVVGEQTHVMTRECYLHGGGSLWIPWAMPFNESWPRDVLTREFFLMLEREDV